MVDVPIHQEDPAVQRTLLINIVISMVTEKTASTPTPPTTQAQVQMCSTSCWKDSSREAWNALLVQGNLRWTTDDCCRGQYDSVILGINIDDGNPSRANIKQALRSVLMEPKVHIKMEMEIHGSSRGLEVGSIRRIQGIGYGVLEFLGVGTTFDIFQNIHILYLEYGVLSYSGYGVLDFIPLWSLLKKFKKDDYTSFHDKERYECVGPKVTSSQVGKRSQDDDKIFDLADDLKEAQDQSLSCK
ncbi:hypothetical protein Tco_0966629 [Tanacetum coccineum]